jgi:hypothetical protein
MRRFHRVTAPGVTNGRVRRKNNWRHTSSCYDEPRDTPGIERQRPGEGYRHLLLKRDVARFLALLPDWPELSRGLNVVLLAPGERWSYGWHRPGVVALCAWERGLWDYVDLWWYEANRGLFDRLGVPSVETTYGARVLEYNESTARAFQLLEVLLHELGHHHDCITNRSRRVSRGEPYAEAYARRYADLIWDRYLNEFGLD